MIKPLSLVGFNSPTKFQVIIRSRQLQIELKIMNNTIKLIKIEETDNRTFDEVIGELKTEGYNRFNIKVTKTDMFLVAKA